MKSKWQKFKEDIRTLRNKYVNDPDCILNHKGRILKKTSLLIKYTVTINEEVKAMIEKSKALIAETEADGCLTDFDEKMQTARDYHKKCDELNAVIDDYFKIIDAVQQNTVIDSNELSEELLALEAQLDKIIEEKNLK